MEYGSHILAAEAGCPKCKKPMNSLHAVHAEGGWRNYCCDSKCKGTLDYTVGYETKAPAQQYSAAVATKTVKAPQVLPVSSSWAYVEDYNRWCNSEGKTVKLKDLSEDELLEAMHALQEANFKKRGSTIGWMISLPRKPGKLVYPVAALTVGKDTALAKLEEMREVAIERGLFGIST